MSIDPLDPVSPLDLRIGDAEREAAAQALSEHYTAGRLDAAEFQTRLDTVYAARTGRELLPLFRDLPGPAPHHPPLALPVPPPAPQPMRRPVLPALLVVALAFVVLTSVIGFPPFFFFPLVWLWFGGRRWHRAWH